MQIDHESTEQLRKDVAKVIKVLACLVALCGLTALRFQRVTVRDLAAQQTNSYWRVLLPGQERKVPLPAKGDSETAEYNLRGLYGLLNVDRKGFIRITLTNSNSGLSDPSIEAAERINLLQMQRQMRRAESAP